MTCWRRVVGTTALLCAIAGAKGVWGQELFLVPGVGVPGVVEIGRPESAVDRGRLGPLEKKFNLNVRDDSRGIVILVVCAGIGCVTERNVAVGMTEDVIVRRYGKWLEEQRLKEGRFLRYDGVGFRIETGVVRAIYILPRSQALK